MHHHRPPVSSFLLTLALAVGVRAQATLAEAVEQASAFLQQATTAEAGKDLEKSKQELHKALALLDKAPGADADAGAAFARWQLATLAFRLGESAAEEATWQKVAAYYTAQGPDQRFYARQALRNRAGALGRLGRHQETLAIQEAVLAECRQQLAADAKELVDTRWDLAVTLVVLNKAPEAVAIWEEIVAYLKGLPKADPDEIERALSSYSSALESMERFEAAEPLYRERLANLEAAGKGKTPDYRVVQLQLAWNLQHNGSAEAALAMLREIEAEAGYADGDPKGLVLTSRIGYALMACGQNKDALPLLQRAVAGLRALPPAPENGLNSAEFWLASCLANVGQRPAAIALLTETYDRVRATDPPTNEGRLDFARNLAGNWRAEGDLERARALIEDSLRIYEQATFANADAPNGHYQEARLALGDTLSALGDHAGALELYEAVLAQREHTLPPSSFRLNGLRLTVASRRHRLGDVAGALALARQAYDATNATLPSDSTFRNRIRINLGAFLYWSGDREGFATLNREAEASLVRTSAAPSSLAVARSNVAEALWYQGDPEGARARWEQVVADVPDARIADMARGGLGLVAWRQGDHEKAKQLLRTAVGTVDDDPTRREHQRHLLLLLADCGDGDAAAEQVNTMLREMRVRLADLAPLSANELRHAAFDMRQDVDAALSVLPADAAAFRTRLFEFAETLRAASGPPEVDRFFAGGEKLDTLRKTALRARQRLNDLVAGATDEALLGDEPPPSPDDVQKAVRERDAADRALRSALGQRAMHEVTVSRLAEGLGRDGAAVGFLRYQRWRNVPGKPAAPEATTHYLVHVVLSDGAVQRLELGPAAEVDALVEAWRTAIGQSIVRGRNPDGPAADAAKAGAALRARVLDPVFAAAGKARRFFTCLDGALHLVPLDALPEGKDLVGAQRQLVLLPSFAPLVVPPQRSRPAPSLLAVGGVAFNAELPGRFRGAEAGGPGGRLFRPLPATSEEVLSLAALFAEAFRQPATLLKADDATKAAIGERAGAARYLHLATHGYFAPESIRSEADPESRATGGLAFHDAVIGLAPATLCGLALAGANLGRDSLGRVPGILTAEELAGLDLRRCELAVLSACETNVGIERAGQGVQSLQAALHAAGVGTAITSLWQVGDAAARDLMLDFYQRLWVQKKPPAEALWAAKMQARKRGAPERDWAAWVLTGLPEGARR